MRNEYQRGQVLLISLLLLSIATTVVLSVIGRSTTDVSMSNQITESSRAFSAAEAGIEEVLKTGAGTAGTQVLSSGASYAVSKATIGGATGIYQFPKKVTVGSSETLWLIGHNADGTIKDIATTDKYTANSIDVCWSQESPIPALVVSVVYYKTAGGQYGVARGAYDPDGTRAGTNKFSSPSSTSGGCGDGNTTYKQTITFGDFTPAISPAVDTLLMLRLQPVYNDTFVAINASGTIPSQGSRLESFGTTQTGVTRKIIVYQQYRSPPSIFDSAVYSQGSFGH